MRQTHILSQAEQKTHCRGYTHQTVDVRDTTTSGEAPHSRRTFAKGFKAALPIGFKSKAKLTVALSTAGKGGRKRKDERTKEQAQFKALVLHQKFLFPPTDGDSNKPMRPDGISESQAGWG